MENELAIDLLCARNADVSAEDKEGNTPLLVALDKEFRNIAEKLVDSGAAVTGSNRDGLTPLHLSCRNGYNRLTKKLIELGAIVEVNEKNREGKTPLHFALMSDVSLAKDLLDFGANMYVRDSKGDTPLGLSVRNETPLKKLTREEFEVLDFTETSKDDLMTLPGPTCPQKSFADGPGLADGGHVNCRYTFTLFACDEKGRLRSVGGDAVRIIAKESSLTRYEAHVSDKTASSCLEVCDVANGTYPVVYDFSIGGRYELHIMIDDEPIMGSPYVVSLLGSVAPLPPAIDTASYSPSEYTDEEVRFASNEGIGEVDLAIVCDTTSSMSGEIEKARLLIKELIKAVKDEKLCTDLRIAIIAYRDHPPEESTYVTKVWKLNDDENAVILAIDSLSAKGGGDPPEADALFEVSRLNWDEANRPHAARLAVLIGDAPPHGIAGAIYTDAFPDGCPEGHDWSVLAETCRSKNISVFTVACRNNVFTQKAFSSIAASSGGQCTKIENSNQIIDLIKMHVQLLLDRRLAYCKISDTIIRLPLTGTTEERKTKVAHDMANKRIAVRSLKTSGGKASLKSHSLTAEDVEIAIKTFKILDRLAGTVRDRALTDWLGKQLYALKKITDEAT
ncbi:uncharacterized protein [Oscarella lobularis]|uniref:uncharacterized protein isoform X2 n=1 Tax=Oscarella lobularis TaxID=121494 RepID=UPI0033130A9A